MSASPVTKVVRHLRYLLSGSEVEAVPDAALLERFVRHHDDAAFEALVNRHGSLVLGVCRRMLTSEHDVEDVFQATFLVLIRRANAIRKRESLGSWLHGVACRVAMKARVQG